MSIIVFNDLTQAQFDSAEQLIISKVRTGYPQLDLRTGTVLREQLIRPAAELYALDGERMTAIAQDTSLLELSKQSDPDPVSVNAVLSNFNMTLNTGFSATGTVLVRVNANRVYTLPAGLTFSTLPGLKYAGGTLTRVRVGANTSAGEIELRTADGISYYFLYPLIAAAEDIEYNIPAGTAMDPTSSIYGYVSSSAYTDFTGGLNASTLTEAIASIPDALTHRALTDRNAISARLHGEFDSTNTVIQDISVQGYGDDAQLRDKHNLMGWAVGARVDIWVRTFTNPVSTTLIVDGTWVSANTYQLTVGVSDAPGYYAVRSVCEVDSVAISSYPVVTDIRTVAASTANHDIDVTRSPTDVVGTVYQGGTIVVSGVPYADSTREFRVDLYTAPGLASIQAFVDDRSVASVGSDCLVRCPLICLVDVSTTIYRKSGVVLDVTALQTQLINYINSRSFTQRLTRSELANILIQAGASRVDLTTTGFQLSGRLRDALGNWLTLQGDVLDIQTIFNAAALVTPQTVVFAAIPGSINLTVVTE